MNTLPPPERSYLQWRLPTTIEGEARLLIPHSDPHEYEFPFDLLFDTEEQAIQGLADYGKKEDAFEEGWVLCTVTCTPTRTAPDPFDED